MSAPSFDPAAALALVIAALAAGCGSPSTCAELGAPSGLATQAARLRLEAYAPEQAACNGNQVATAAQPVAAADFAPTARAQLDLPPGAYVVHMLAYGDLAMTDLLGEGCSLTSVGSGQSTCLSLALAPAGCAPLAHENGLGGTYQSCAARGSYDGATAGLACASAMLPGATCADRTCSGGAGGRAICAKSVTDCTCWTYTGASAGTVHNAGGGSCDCGASGDPIWN